MSKKGNINQLLHDKSNELVPTEIYQKGNLIRHKIYNILQRCRKDVNRVIIGGSIGKRTAVDCGPDFDLVIFLNNKRPPFNDLLKEIKQILDNSRDELQGYKFKTIAETGLYISFQVSGLEFQLSPAMNFEKTHQYSRTIFQIDILDHPEKHSFLWSPGLAESAVEFVKNQPGFINSIVRLAKFWNSNVDVNGYIRGRSSIIELVAIKSCEEIERNNIYDAFKRFLQNMTDLINLEIYFEKFYNKSQIPARILHNIMPIIMDPVNNYNNLGYVLAKRPGSPTTEAKILMEAAQKSLIQLETLKSDRNLNRESIENIFVQNNDDTEDMEDDYYYYDDSYASQDSPEDIQRRQETVRNIVEGIQNLQEAMQNVREAVKIIQEAPPRCNMF